MSLSKLNLILISTTVGLVLSGCSTLFSPGVGSIPKSVVTDKSVSVMSEKYTKALDDSGQAKTDSWIKKSESCMIAVSAAEITVCKNYRNGMISEIMMIVDHNYHNYAGNLVAGRAKSDFYFDTARTALETASTLFVPTDTKSILSALATVSGAVKDSAESSFYFEQTGPALIGLMQADRATIETEIIGKRQQDYPDYTVADAMRDLGAYYRAGTMASAVNSLNNTVTEEKSIAKILLDAEKINAAKKAATPS